MSILSDNELPRMDVGQPGGSDDLGAPLYDGMPQALPAWARPSKRPQTPSFRALQGMSVDEVERALRALAPNAYDQVKPPQLAHTSVYVGSDGLSAPQQWSAYLRALVNTEIAITAREEGRITTSGRMAGGGKGAPLRCVNGHKATALVDGKCAGGCGDE